ncbi:MAG: hypothetical protein ACPL7L_00750, partial [bacterium]
LALLGAFTLSLAGFSLTSRTLANAASPQQAPVSAQVTVPPEPAFMNNSSASDSQNSLAQQAEEKGTAIVEDKENEAQEQSEKALGVESEQDENLPGGGHQDPEGVEIDHQFEGVE